MWWEEPQHQVGVVLEYGEDRYFLLRIPVEEEV